jgi:hypothetical protein
VLLVFPSDALCKAKTRLSLSWNSFQSATMLSLADHVSTAHLYESCASCLRHMCTARPNSHQMSHVQVVQGTRALHALTATALSPSLGEPVFAGGTGSSIHSSSSTPAPMCHFMLFFFYVQSAQSYRGLMMCLYPS